MGRSKKYADHIRNHGINHFRRSSSPAEKRVFLVNDNLI